MLQKTKFLLLSALSLPVIAFACTAGEIGPDGSNSDEGTGSGGTTINPGDGGTTGLPPVVIDPEVIGAPPTASCADGVLDDDEACDDGNMNSDDGCGSNCRYVEPGFVCPEPGEPCRPFAKCGDSALIFPEQCDDGNVAEGDGCSPTCKFEIGWTCNGSPSMCAETTCGDGTKEGAETCDEGDAVPFDGCSGTCQGEPICTTDGCTSACGDGLIIAPEVCDDGNGIDGDGCSAACQPEPGYECAADPAACEQVNGECVLRVPVIFRDFDESHSDFAVDCKGSDGGLEATPGLVEPTLTNGKPVATALAPEECISNLGDWYTNTVAQPIVGSLVLFDNGNGGFVNRYGENGEQWKLYEPRWCGNGDTMCMASPPEFMGCNDEPFDPELDECFFPCLVPNGCGGDCTCAARTLEAFDGTPVFFPVDADMTPDAGVVAKIPPQYGYPWPLETAVNPEAPAHNFHFTTEVAYWFQYDAAVTARLDFTGDDDVWVFVNDRLAVDLGSVHQPVDGFVEISAATADTYGLTDGKVYRITIFHADRKIESSSFRLTLSGFSTARSECVPVCGDGIIAAGEQCDDGTDENMGGHNRCNADCTIGEYCGDGVVQTDSEECDDADPARPANCAGCRIILVK